MRLLKTIAIAFSMFSAVPMPQFVWDEDAMRHVLVAFPLVGVLIGGLVWAGGQLCAQLHASAMVRALLLTALPLLVTGGIHLDGFCDTWDALSSHQGQERMRQILKDPHIGAFGVMHLALLLLATFVLWAELPASLPAPLLAGFVLSRALCGLSVAAFPLAEGAGIARSFADGADRRVVRGACAAIALAPAGVLVLGGGWVMAAVALLVFLVYRWWLIPTFGGLSGDLCGWFVTTCEFAMLAGLCVSQVQGVIA